MKSIAKLKKIKKVEVGGNRATTPSVAGPRVNAPPAGYPIYRRTTLSN